MEIQDHFYQWRSLGKGTIEVDPTLNPEKNFILVAIPRTQNGYLPGA